MCGCVLILLADSTDEGLKKAKSGSDEEPWISGVVRSINQNSQQELKGEE